MTLNKPISLYAAMIPAIKANKPASGLDVASMMAGKIADEAVSDRSSYQSQRKHAYRKDGDAHDQEVDVEITIHDLLLSPGKARHRGLRSLWSG